MKKTIFITALILICSQYRAQNLDSLLSVWNDQSQPDSIRVNAYYDYIWNGYLFSNPDTVEVLTKALHQYSQSKKYLKASALAYNLQGVANSIQSNNSIALENYKNRLLIEEKMGDQKGIANSLSNIGLVYKDLGDFTLSIEFFEKSLNIRKKIGDKKGLSTSLNNIGTVYWNMGNYPLSLEYFQKSLLLSEELGDEQGISSKLKNIGIIYHDLGEHLTSLEYYKKCILIEEKLGNKNGYAVSLGNIGILYKNLGDLELALDYYFKSLATFEEIGNLNGVAGSLNNIGIIYLEQENFNKALEYYLNALSIKEEIEDKKGVAISLHNIGILYKEQKKYALSLKYCHKSLNLAEEIGVLEKQKGACECLYENYKTIGESSKALNYYEQMVSLKDSMFNEENTKKLTQLEMQYDFDKQKVADSITNAEAEKVHLANLEAEKAKGAQQQTEIAAQKKQNIFLFVGLALVALFGFFMYNRFKVTQKQKGIIEHQKQEVETQKVKVESTLNELESTHQKLESTHEQLEESHKEITDSINYAERIQRSFLASKDLLDHHLTPSSGGVGVGGGGDGYFVFFQPKDVVSGDFYWASQLNNSNFAFCCADSTGHGVPGAIMSILNISSLEKAIEKETEPHKILVKTREFIIERLKKDGSPEGGKDGMDCSLLVLNQDKTLLTFASANNPVFIVTTKNGVAELVEAKPDKMPVGKHDKDQTPFTLQTVTLQKGDVIYTLTDGMPDQFGGEKGKKYMIKNLKNLFLSIAHLPMAEQHTKLEEEFINWKGENEQVDDVCIIGVRV